MKHEKETICHCSKSIPILLNGTLPYSPVRCIKCKLSMPLDRLSVKSELILKVKQWHQLYLSHFKLLSGDDEHSQWRRSKLLDEVGDINMEGLRLSQQLNPIRNCYYWMFQDINDEGFRPVQICPFCGASMQEIENNDFNVCHDCMVAYPIGK